MVIKGSDEIVLLFTAATDYNLKIMNYDRSINPAEVCEQIINNGRGHVGMFSFLLVAAIVRADFFERVYIINS